MPSNLVFKAANTIHQGLIKLSGGRIGWRAGKMPVVELTTTGRKSGQQRSTMLTTPLEKGDTLALVASAGGNDTHPAWFLNLQANPDVEVRTQAGRRQMRARVTSGAERQALWDEITAAYDNYAGYQAKTDREIPVVLLEPSE